MECFTLPLADSRIVTVSALVMKEVTGPVASYNMTGMLSDLEAEFFAGEMALNCFRSMRLWGPGQPTCSLAQNIHISSRRLVQLFRCLV